MAASAWASGKESPNLKCEVRVVAHTNIPLLGLERLGGSLFGFWVSVSHRSSLLLLLLHFCCASARCDGFFYQQLRSIELFVFCSKPAYLTPTTTISKKPNCPHVGVCVCGDLHGPLLLLLLQLYTPHAPRRPDTPLPQHPTTTTKRISAVPPSK